MWLGETDVVTVAKRSFRSDLNLFWVHLHLDFCMDPLRLDNSRSHESVISLKNKGSKGSVQSARTFGLINHFKVGIF